MHASTACPLLPALTALALIASVGCGDRQARGSSPTSSPTGRPTAQFYHDATARYGVGFVHAQSRNGNVDYLPETLGPGVGCLDFDGDGWEDLFFVQGSGNTDGADPSTVPASHLYRRALESTSFEEVGEVSGAGLKSWGQGCLAFDYDNDGYVDLLVAAYHQPVRLLRNNGDGTFREIGRRADLAPGDRWWNYATAIDYDRDGFQDVYVGAYVVFGPKEWVPNPPMVPVPGFGSLPETMLPRPYAPVAKAFFRNRADGRFEDVTTRLKVSNPSGRSLGTLSADLDDDGWPELLVANDVSPCVLFKNVGGSFKDGSRAAWLNESRGSMGLALGDPNEDGKYDILCSHWMADIPAMYMNQLGRTRRLAFRDDAPNMGFEVLSRALVGWAVSFVDLSNDGRDDIIIIHGHTNRVPGRRGLLEPQPAVLMLAREDGTFGMRAPALANLEVMDRKRVGRGAAFADLDHDGFIDVAVGVNNGPAEIWENVGGTGGWIGVEVVGTLSNRDGLGAALELRSGPIRKIRQRASGESFFSTNSRRLVFGLGRGSTPCDITVSWPSGLVDRFTGLSRRRYHRLIEGSAPADSRADAKANVPPAVTNR